MSSVCNSIKETETIGTKFTKHIFRFFLIYISCKLLAFTKKSNKWIIYQILCAGVIHCAYILTENFGFI